MKTRARTAARSLVVAALMTIASCGDQPGPAGPDAPSEPAIVTPPEVPPGPPRDAGKPAGNVVVTPSPMDVDPNGQVTLTVTVTDKKGSPLPDRPVAWSSTNGGSFNVETGTTDQNGQAMTTYTVVTAAGTEHVITATTGTRSASTTLTVVAGPAVDIAMDSGPSGSETVGATIGIGALVTDLFGNGVPGHEVIWAVTGGGGSISPSTTTFTDADGVATVQWTLGTVVEDQTATASAIDDDLAQPLGGSPVEFLTLPEPGPADHIEIDPPSASISGVGGTSTSFTAKVYDQYDNELFNPLISWSSSDARVFVNSAGDVTVVEEIAETESVTVDITATSGDASASATLEINAT